MKSFCCRVGQLATVLLVFAGLLSAGCRNPHVFAELEGVSPDAMTDTFHVGDMVAVKLTGNREVPETPFAERVKDDGTITLPQVGAVRALGKTTGQLQKEIHDLYVPKFYRFLTVTVAAEGRLYYVQGEVKGPGPKEYPGHMTIVKAITAAGGFTDFARRSKVRLTHTDGRSEIVNIDKAIRDPRYDVRVYPGDKIFVPRRYL